MINSNNFPMINFPVFGDEVVDEVKLFFIYYESAKEQWIM